MIYNVNEKQREVEPLKYHQLLDRKFYSIFEAS